MWPFQMTTWCHMSKGWVCPTAAHVFSTYLHSVFTASSPATVTSAAHQDITSLLFFPKNPSLFLCQVHLLITSAKSFCLCSTFVGLGALVCLSQWIRALDSSHWEGPTLLWMFSSMKWGRMKFISHFFCLWSRDFGQTQPLILCLIINKIYMMSFQ